jgi:hypothetical protein
MGQEKRHLANFITFTNKHTIEKTKIIYDLARLPKVACVFKITRAYFGKDESESALAAFKSAIKVQVMVS